ncbi:MAG: HD domain-containing protein [Planctomycetia bacterium]|nr:HD domain-containing protein [Planctomycetia bacterium]
MAIPSRAQTFGALYEQAFLFASSAHRGQTRKDGKEPYLAHLARVSGMALAYGASEECAAVALLHDVVEDCGGLETAQRVRELFGDAIADGVLALSDSLASDRRHKAPWQERKEAYVARMERESDEILLVSSCDKIDNMRSLIIALRVRNDTMILQRFHAGRERQFWYYGAIGEILCKRQIPTYSEYTSLMKELFELWKE